MNTTISMLLVPCVSSSPRHFSDLPAAHWRLGPSTLAGHTRRDTLGAIVRQDLSLAPPAFALVGLSTGRYIVLELFRKANSAPEKVVPDSKETQAPPLHVGMSGKPQGWLR